MASMFLRLRVADYAKWKPVFDERERARREQGFTGHSLHHAAGDANDIIIAFRVNDLYRAKQFANSEDLRTTMQRAGVEGPPGFWFAEDIEDKSY